VKANAQYEGPAIIELADTNIVIGADQPDRVDTRGNVLISV